MLFVGCNCCGQIGPLLCGGTFMPHVPMTIISLPYGPACPICGPMPPVFTCTMCYTVQMLYFPGQQINPATVHQMGARGVAPVIQANQNSNHSVLNNMMRETMMSFAKEAGRSLGDQVGDFLGGYFFGNQSY